MESPDILFARRGAAGIVTLNRPKALNAVTHEMVRALARQLAAWADDGAVTRIILTAAGERAFSAGGDIRALYEFGRAGRQQEALGFFREEYTLNAAIKRYPKPYVSLIDGIVMGGGFGISVHGSHRVAGDRFQFAMPEVGIGFFPDVGGTWVLARMPDQVGTWCALTGDRLKTSDAVAAGIATHHVRSDRFGELTDALCGNVPVDATLAAFAQPAGEEPAAAGPVMARRNAIARLFAAGRVEDILQNLDAEAEREWAATTAAAIRTKSPTSLKLALAQVRRGRDWTFAQCMQAELRIVSRIVYGHDFYEGVRAVIVDKDNAPRWQPASLAEVSDAVVEQHFASLGDQELMLP
jgi:enoyl-CoA hydratase